VSVQPVFESVLCDRVCLCAGGPLCESPAASVMHCSTAPRHCGRCCCVCSHRRSHRRGPAHIFIARGLAAPTKSWPFSAEAPCPPLTYPVLPTCLAALPTCLAALPTCLANVSDQAQTAQAVPATAPPPPAAVVGIAPAVRSHARAASAGTSGRASRSCAGREARPTRPLRDCRLPPPAAACRMPA